MTHQHHDHSHHHHHGSTQNIRTAFLLNLGFAVAEIIGGLLTNSLAILTDALHDFGDAMSLGMGWYLEKYSRKEEDAQYTYGYRRFSLLSALINTIILVVGSTLILFQAVPRLMNPEETHAPGMALMAVLGIAINGVAALRLKNEESMNARVISWHLIEDVLGWAAVLIASIVMMLVDAPILDPILSILISLYILYNVVRNLGKTVKLFLQAVPEQINLDEISKQVQALPGVLSTHHLHAWSLEGESHVLTLHVMVEEKTERRAVIGLRNQIRELLKNRNLVHTTIEIEYGPNDCMNAVEAHAHAH
ncbi:MAG: cation transporter [Anaerolineales bacterium]|nr:MAG: cation transporter [Anaerolineales bacterium]